MGSPPDEEDRDENEDPVPVTLSLGFYLGRFVVTQKQWWRLMRTAPWGHDRRVLEGDEYPATYVSWDDAMEFCEKVTQRQCSAGLLPLKYTLPTEAQWEYACRAGTKSRYSFGDDQSELGDYGWFYENAWETGEDNAHRVGQTKPNQFGLYDMHGNVWEWCLDDYQDSWWGQRPTRVFAKLVQGAPGWKLEGKCRSLPIGAAEPCGAVRRL
jgi:formylglycine-generating enzyme